MSENQAAPLTAKWLGQLRVESIADETPSVRTFRLRASGDGPLPFTFVMLAMYFFKMRRAAALFGRLESDEGSPPPGSAPPLGGTDGPPASLGQKIPPEKSPPPASTDQ